MNIILRKYVIGFKFDVKNVENTYYKQSVIDILIVY